MRKILKSYCSQFSSILFWCSFVIFCSCETTATKQLTCIDCQSINDSTLSFINGDYSTRLWKYIAPKAINKKKYNYDTNELVELRVIDSKRVKATLIKNGSAIRTKIIRGKVKNGYFSARAKYRFIGIPFIFFFEYSNKIDFSLINKNELYMAISESEFGNIALMTAGDDNYWSQVYKKQ